MTMVRSLYVKSTKNCINTKMSFRPHPNHANPARPVFHVSTRMAASRMLDHVN